MFSTEKKTTTLSHAIRVSFINFCEQPQYKDKINQANFDLLHDLRDQIIKDLEAK